MEPVGERKWWRWKTGAVVICVNRKGKTRQIKPVGGRGAGGGGRVAQQ